jgi:hypothetical protein
MWTTTSIHNHGDPTLSRASRYLSNISTAHKFGNSLATPVATSPLASTTPHSNNVPSRHDTLLTPPALTQRVYHLRNTFIITPRTRRNSKPRSSPCVKATTHTSRSRRPPVCGHPTPETARAEGRRAIRTVSSRNSPTKCHLASS